MRRYVQRCCINHDCAAEQNALPTRLLDVGETVDSPWIKLVETSGQSGSYITLSHCWGGAVNQMTTRDNYDSHRSGILIEQLPAKFRDAVKITRLLGKRYLWIDSLCIVQRDPEWEWEASRMASVYANSWLNIAAAGSADASQGCFNVMDPNRRADYLPPDQTSVGIQAARPPFALRMPGSDGTTVIGRQGSFALLSSPQCGMISLTNEWMPSSKRSKPKTYCIPYFGAEVDVLKDQPLSRRAWTLQERALSPRTLHFCTDQMYWECQHGLLGEDGCRVDRGPFPIQSVIEKQQLPESRYGLRGDESVTVAMHVTEAGPSGGYIPIEGDPPPSPTAFGRWDGGWLAIIEDFSGRDLSNSDDKLPALSGIAHTIAQQTGEEYLAGLWRNHIFEDLHWRVLARYEALIQRPGGFLHVYGRSFRDPRRTAAYRAPSWSWACLDAQISYIPLDYNHLVARLVDCHINRSQIDPLAKSMKVAGSNLK